MVISDVLAGLVLINHKQRIENATHAMNTPKPTHIAINPLDEAITPAVTEEAKCEVKKGLMPVEWSSVRHYYKFAAAAYGYWWYIIEKPCAHFCSLRPYLNCIPCRCKNQQVRIFPFWKIYYFLF